MFIRCEIPLPLDRKGCQSEVTGRVDTFVLSFVFTGGVRWQARSPARRRSPK